MSNLDKLSKKEKRCEVPKMSQVTESVDTNEGEANGNVITWARNMEVGRNGNLCNTNYGSTDISSEDLLTLTYNALLEIPLWKELPLEIMILVTEFGAGFIQSC
jgi:hypothetical protein